VSSIIDKLAAIVPEIIIAIGATVCLFIGLSSSLRWRKATVWVAGLTLAASVAVPAIVPQLDLAETGFAAYAKVAIAVVGILLVMVAASVPGSLKLAREVDSGQVEFDAGLVARGEFFAFMLLSLAGAMLCAGASDMVWLFLALELTSLPTYVMVATGRDKTAAQESGVKYFFLGAMSAAIFLYGFTMIYGATGYTDLAEIRAFLRTQDELPPLLLLGFVLSVIGLMFKIAAVPMHAYAADVYEGAHVAVTTFLAFVPKTAGFLALIMLLSLIGWPLPAELNWLLWVLAALTMTVGNVLGLLQTSVKRVLAYSSIAHSGYILVGLLVGPGIAQAAGAESYIGNGLGAVLFYLVAYGLATLGAFAVLGSLEVDGDEAQTFDDISGLHRRQPILAAVMLLSVLSLIGLPPLVGFLGKIYLFGSAIAQSDTHPHYVYLVIIAVINSAISAVYYLRIVGACYFGDPSHKTTTAPAPSRQLAATLAAVLALVLGITGNWLVEQAGDQTSEMKSPPSGIVDAAADDRVDPTP